MLGKLKTIIYSPLFIFGVFALIILAFLIITTGFQVPSYYTDLVLAQQIANLHGSMESVINPEYEKFNYIYNSFSFFLALFIVCLIFRIWEFKDFAKFCNIQNRIILSIWVYASYLLYAELDYAAYMYGLQLYVYPSDGDSWGIPMFGEMIYSFLLGIVYYVLMHIWCFLLYRNRVSSKVKFIITAILLCIVFDNIIADFSARYSLVYTTLLFMMSFIWIFVIISLSRLTINKMNEFSKEDSKTNFNWFIFIILSIFFSVICYFVHLLNVSLALPFIVAIILTFMFTDKMSYRKN